MTTTLFLRDTPSVVPGALPTDTQFPAFTVITPGIRISGSSIPRTLSTSPGVISTTVPGTEYENTALTAGQTGTSYFRMFVSDPVIGGFYGAGPMRWYGTISSIPSVAGRAVKSGFSLVTYFWRPSTGAIVSDVGTAKTNYQVVGTTFLDPSAASFIAGMPFSFDESGSSTGNGVEFGWNVKTGDVFVLEVAVLTNNASGAATALLYQLLYGGNSQVGATSVTQNGSNPTAFIQLPFDLQFQQSTQTKVTPLVFRDMFSFPGS